MKKTAAAQQALGLMLMVCLLSVVAWAEDASSGKSAAWRARMDHLAATLNTLMPDLVSRSRFSEAGNRKRVIASVRTLRGLTHGMGADAPLVTSDPSVVMFSHKLQEDLQEAETALQEGQPDYAQAVLFSVVDTCMGCHTRNDKGAKFPTLALMPQEKGLSAFERATLHSATRHYAQAMEEYLAVVADARGPVDNGLDWDHAVGAGMTLAVRTLNSPEDALKLAGLVVAHPTAPRYLRQNALAWKEHLNQWKQEKAVESQPAALLDRANSLLQQAMSSARVQSTRGNVVLYLRASRLLHDVLGQSPDPERKQEALYLLGVAYLGISELELYDVHPLIFEACVRTRPHSPTSLRCYERYEGAMYMLYSGSSGRHLPAEVQRTLRELELQALPE